jgi:type VI secretion system secreted protein Hcp
MILLNFKTKIKGNSTIKGHEDWIVIDSVQMGVGRTVHVINAKDRSPSVPSFSEITLAKSTDISSADLFLQAVCGKSLGTAELHFLQTGGPDKKDQVFLTILFEDALITSYAMSSGGDHPSESFSLNFTKISYQYDAFSGTKIITGTPKKWNLIDNAVY